MGATVLVVDTNQLRDSPLLRSRDWEELLSRADDWDLRFVVPEVCLLEAISVVRRKWLGIRAEVAKPRVGELGLDEAKRAMLDDIDSKIEGYEDALRARLSQIEAEIVPIPDAVSILDLVQRAIDRRAPYSEGRKDGLRDTLIWYTTRSIAADDNECEVWLISANHNDFGDQSESEPDLEACPYPFHPHLTEELEADGLSDRVSYVRTVGRLMQHLASAYDALPPAERAALIERLDGEEFERQLADAVLYLQLNPATAALPVRTMDAMIQSFTSNPDSLQFVDAAMRGGGVWTAQFHQTIEAAVDLIDADGDTTTFDKTLNVAGRLEAGADGTVKELILTSVEALPNDPMRRARSHTFGVGSYIPEDVLKGFWARDLGLSSEVLRGFQGRDLGLSKEILRGFQGRDLGLSKDFLNSPQSKDSVEDPPPEEESADDPEKDE